MTRTNYRATERRILGKTVLAALLVCAWFASSHAQTALPALTQQYVYWTNSQNGSIGRATTTGTGASEDFIPSRGARGGAGLTVNGNYIYWTSANGGSATTIARANLNGTGANWDFITGAHNPCGVAVSGTAGQSGRFRSA